MYVCTHEISRGDAAAALAFTVRPSVSAAVLRRVHARGTELNGTLVVVAVIVCMCVSGGFSREVTMGEALKRENG